MKLPFRLLAAVFVISLTLPAHARRAPNLTLKDLAGNTHKVAELRGSIVVLNFWATWCVPCREELPLLSHLSQEYAAKHVRFIAVSADEAKNRARVDQLLSTNKPGMDVWMGADLDMLQRAGLGNELPATLILDENGEAVARILGEAREEDVRGAVDWLLNGRKGDPPAPLTRRY